MGMQTDVLASAPLTVTGQLVGQNAATIPRCRIKALLIVPDSGAGTVVLRDGGASGPIKATINVKASSTNNEYMLIPGEGLLFQTNVHVTITSVLSVTGFYA